jgi:hypothetical protein
MAQAPSRIKSEKQKKKQRSRGQTFGIGDCAWYEAGMARLVRVEVEDVICHLCARGNAR